MSVIERVRARAAADPKHIVLPEGEEERTIQAAAMCVTERLARITLIGREEVIREKAAQLKVNLTGVSVIDHRRSSDVETLAARYYEARRAKGVTIDEARAQMKDPLYFGNMMVKEGKADGSVSGATHTTGHTVSSALRCLGPKAGLKVVSSFFLMIVFLSVGLILPASESSSRVCRRASVGWVMESAHSSGWPLTSW